MLQLPSYIEPVSKLLAFLSEPFHSAFFPLSLLPILHAARISFAYRSFNKLAGGRTSGVADLAGFLTMAWGGSVTSHILLSLPIPQLLSFSPLLTYTITHLALPDIKRLPSMKTFDISLPLLDALLRTASVATGVEACRNHWSPAVTESISIQLFIGAIASSGGGVLAQTFRVWEPSWRLSRPSFLEQGTMLASTDVWSGTLVAAIYGFLTTSHPIYPRALKLLYPSSNLESPLYSSLDAKTIAASVLTLIYCWRAYGVHYAKSDNPAKPAKTSSSKSVPDGKPKKE